VKRLVWTLILVLCFGSLALAGVGRHGHFEGFPIVKVLVNGQEVASDVPAVNFYGRTMVPVRFVAEALGYSVGWDEETWTASLTDITEEERYREEVRAINETMKTTLWLASEILAGRETDKGPKMLQMYDDLIVAVFRKRPPAGYEEIHMLMCQEMLLVRHILKTQIELPEEPRARKQALEDGMKILEATSVAARLFHEAASLKGIALD